MSVRLEDKIRQVEEIEERLKASKASFIVNYRGLKVAELTELRKNLRKVKAVLQVVKNTLAYKSVKEAGLEKLSKFLSGPTGMIFVEADPVAPAKVIKEFVPNHPHLVIKGGVLGGQILQEDEVKALGNLPGQEILLAQLLAAMQSPLTGLLNVLNAPLRNLIFALRAISLKEGGLSMAKALPEAGEKKDEDTKKKETMGKKEEIIRIIEEMNVLELSELVKELEDRFGVKAVPSVATSQVSAPEEKAKKEEKTEFDVVLAEIGSKKIQVIKEVRKLTSLGLKEAKDLVEAAPKPIKQGVTKEEALKIKEVLEAVGAKVELK